MSPRVLITGISSYTGRWTAMTLKERGWEVHGLVRSTQLAKVSQALEDLQINLHACDQEFDEYKIVCQRARCDVLCHLAGVSASTSINPVRSMLQANVVLGSELLEAAIQNNCRGVVIAGTFWEHFTGPDLSPNSFYAATKIAFRYIVDYYARFHNIHAVELRLFDSYGPADDRKKFLTWFDMAASADSEPIKMTLGRQRLAPIHIHDVSLGIAHACEIVSLNSKPPLPNPNQGCLSYSLPGPELFSLQEMSRIYSKVRGAELRIDWGGMPYSTQQIFEPYIGDKLPGWNPTIDFESGLRSIYTQGKK